MEGDWLTYEQAAERLNITPEAVRQKAIRGRWQRTIGNDKLARVRIPDGWSDAVRTPSERPNERPVQTPSGRASDALLLKALEARWKRSAFMRLAAHLSPSARRFIAAFISRRVCHGVARGRRRRAQQDVAVVSDARRPGAENANVSAYGAAGRATDDRAARGHSRDRHEHRLSHVPGDGHHRLSAQRRACSNTRNRWRRMKARERQNCTIVRNDQVTLDQVERIIL